MPEHGDHHNHDVHGHAHHDPHHEHDHHLLLHHEPSDELDHLDKMAEAHANNPEVAILNQQIVDLLPTSQLPKENAHILDFGCGAGRIAILLAKRPNVASVLGTDITSGMLALARQFQSQEPAEIQVKLSFQQTQRNPTQDLEPLQGQKDLVVMSLVLGHITPKSAGAKVLAAAASTLKLGGKFALAEFLFQEGEDHHHHHHHHARDHAHGNENDVHESGKEKSHHGGHVAYTEDEIRDLFKTCGLEPDEEFIPFEFEWGGITRKCIMAVGTKA